MHYTLQSQEYISDPTFSMWEGTLLTLVHAVRVPFEMSLMSLLFIIAYYRS